MLIAAVGVALGFRPDAGPASLGSGLHAFVEVNPITHFVDAVRVLTLDVEAGSPAVPAQSPVLLSAGWLVGIVGVFGTLAIRGYGLVS